MREGAENANVELGAMLAVVVVLAVIRVVAAFTEDEDAVLPTAEAAMVEVVPRGEARPAPVASDDSAAVLLPAPATDSLAGEEPAGEEPAGEEPAGEEPPASAEAPEPEEPGPQEPATERLRVAPPRLTADLVPELETPDESTLVAELAEDAGRPILPPSNPATPPPAPRPAPPPEERPAPTPEIFETVEQMPELIGGLAGLQRRIRYPDLARRMGVEGRVFVQFIVNEDGSVSNVRTVRGIGAGCDEAAEAAVRASRFTPGRQRGRLVKVRMTLPVTFRAD